MPGRHEITNEQWEAIKDVVPGKEDDPGRTAADNRLFVNAVLYVLKTGIPWADLPERYGKHNSVWRRFDRWCANGTWKKIFQVLGEEGLEEELAEVHLDSSTVKAHQTASTGRREPEEEKNEADDRRCLGRSRGGLTTKIHAVTGKSGQLIDFILTPGQRGDAPEGENLLDKFKPGELGTIVADAAYDSNAIRSLGKFLKAKVCIKPNATRKVKKRYDREVYKHRNQIERFFGRIKRCRRVATRYEKKAANFGGFIWLAALITDVI